MLPMFGITFINQAVEDNFIFSYFLSESFVDLFYKIFIWTSWIPIAITLIYGFFELWVNDRQGKFASGLKFVYLAIDVPSLTEQSPKALENLFSNLYGTKSGVTLKEKWMIGKLQPVFAFEIVSMGGYIQFIVRTQRKFRDIIEAGIYANYPDAEISEIEDYAKDFPKHFPDSQYDMWGAEMTLEKPSHIPIRTYVDFEDQMTGEIKDPLGYTLEQMSRMRPGECFWFQLLIQPSSHDWQKEGAKHINKIFGIEEKNGHVDGPFKTAASEIAKFPFEMLEQATTVSLGGIFGFGEHAPTKEADPWKAFKISTVQQEEAKAVYRKTVKVAHGTKIRMVYIAKKEVFSKGERVPMIKAILQQYSHLNLNKFTMHPPSTPKDDYFWQLWSYAEKQNKLMSAYISRSWGIGADPVFLNAEELATLWHFPTINIKAPLVKKSEARRAEPPVGLPITFLEDTLPMFGQSKIQESLNESLDVIKDEIVDQDHEQKESFLPKVAKKNKPVFDDDSVPPNLPV